MKKRTHASDAMREAFMALYVVVLVGASAVLFWAAFSTQKTVTIDDKAQVMQRKSVAIPVVLELKERRWGNAEVVDKEKMFEISELMRKIPAQAEKEKTTQDEPEFEGKITYIDGRSSTFTLGRTLNMGKTVYYSQNTEYERDRILQMLREETYTPENLAAFFEAPNTVVITGKKGNATLNQEQKKRFQEVVAATTVLTNATERDYALRSSTNPEYTITLYLAGNPRDVLYLVTYDNEFTQVCDVTGGHGTVLYLSESFSQLCGEFVQSP